MDSKRKKYMNRYGVIVVFILTAIVLFMLAQRNKEMGPGFGKTPEESASLDVFAMDTYMTVTAYGKQAEEAVEAARKEILRLDALWSPQGEQSEVAALNRQGGGHVSGETGQLIETSLQLYESTEGAFDITIYPLMQEWGFTTGNFAVPEKERITELLEKVDAGKITYDAGKKMVTLPEGASIDFGGIAKGFTSGRIIDIFKDYQVGCGMVSLGGNVQLYGTKTDGSPWRIAIENPDKSKDYLGVIETADKAIITSGGYERYFEENGQVWHHILNPETGYPADSGLSSVTVVSRDGTMADGLSTSLFIMGKDKALAYWKSNAELFDLVLYEEDGTLTITEGIEDEFSSDFSYKVERHE